MVLHDYNTRMDLSLHELEERERSLSRRRSRLHKRIEFLRGTAAHEPGSRKILDELVAEERELSAERRELHATIGRLRRTQPSAQP